MEKNGDAVLSEAAVAAGIGLDELDAAVGASVTTAQARSEISCPVFHPRTRCRRAPDPPTQLGPWPSPQLDERSWTGFFRIQTP